MPCCNGHGLRLLSGSTRRGPSPPQCRTGLSPAQDSGQDETNPPNVGYRMPPVPGLIMSEDIPGACACIVPTYAMKAAGKRFKDHRKYIS